MKIIPPMTVTPAILTSNVAITETEWTAGTYNLGTERYVGTTLYEVVADPSTTDEPTAGAAKAIPTWIVVGSINRFKMFDFRIGDATEQTGGAIEVTVDTTGLLVNAVALFEIVGTSVQVVVTDATEGVVYDETRSLDDYTGINNWYQYFFAPYNRATEIIFSNLPAYAGTDITITVDAGTSDTAVGEVAMGTQKTLGLTLQNFEFGIEDFSRKERDQFGNFTIVERRFAKIANYDVFLENNEVNAAFRTLSSVRATPVVYIGNEDMPETVVLGFFKDFSTLRTGPGSSEMTLEAESLI